MNRFARKHRVNMRRRHEEKLARLRLKLSEAREELFDLCERLRIVSAGLLESCRHKGGEK